MTQIDEALNTASRSFVDLQSAIAQMGKASINHDSLLDASRNALQLLERNGFAGEEVIALRSAIHNES